MSEEELRHHLGLYQTTGKVRIIAFVLQCLNLIFTCSRNRARFLSAISDPSRSSCAQSFNDKVMGKVCLPSRPLDILYLIIPRVYRVPLAVAICKFLSFELTDNYSLRSLRYNNETPALLRSRPFFMPPFSFVRPPISLACSVCLRSCRFLAMHIIYRIPIASIGFVYISGTAKTFDLTLMVSA